LGDPLLELIEPYQLHQARTLSPLDPTADRDPFFLRSQSWSDSTLPAVHSAEVRYQEFPGGVSISVEGISGTWHLHQPLRPLAASADFLILAATDASLFQNKMHRGDSAGEGLFAIAWDDFISASVKERKLPVYFLPMPGSGWVGAVSAIHSPDEGLVVVRTSDGDVLPLEESDLLTLVKVGRANLILSYALAQRAQPDRPQGPSLYPPTLSTAGFGLVFTGLHGEIPSASLFQSGVASQSVWKQLPRLVGLFYRNPSAHAHDWISFQQIVEQVFPKLSHVGSIIGVMLTAAVVFKYTLFRSRYIESEKKFHPWKEFYRRQAEAWKNNLTIFGHNVTFVATSPYIFTGNALQFLSDRFLPHLAAADNSIVRKLFQFFVNFSVKNNRDLNVNDRVLKGAYVTAAIDTLCVAYQLYSFVPGTLARASQNFPELKPRVDHILSHTHGAAASFALEETTYVAVNHLTQGPALYASVATAQAEQRAAVEIDEEMKNDPKTAGWEEERKRRIEARKTQKLDGAGLAKKDEFLFDAQTVYTAITSMFGYAPEGAATNSRTPETHRETYLGEDRHGLILPALNRALNQAKQRAKDYPQDPDLRETVALLESLWKDGTYFERFIKNPLGIFEELGNVVTGKGLLTRLRKTRRDLLLLTYAEAMSHTSVQNIPESWWNGRSPGAARLASMFFQNAFFSFKEGNRGLSGGFATHHPLFATQNGKTLQVALKREAQARLKDLYPEEFDALFLELGDAKACGVELQRRHPMEEQLVYERLVHSAYEKHLKVEQPYSDPVKGWFTKWQVSRARHRAMKEFARLQKKKFSLQEATPEERELWQRLHAKAMMAVVGMTPVYDAPGSENLQSAVESLAESRFLHFTGSEQIQAFVTSHPEGTEFLDRMRAIFTAEAYLEVTTQTNIVPSLSPAQPGALQSLRNSRLVRKLPGLLQWPVTVATRFFEAATYSDGHHLGFYNWVRRSVPVVTDMKEGLIRTLQLSTLYLGSVWAFNYLFWHIQMPWYLHASSFLFGYPFVVGPQLFLQRAFKNVGWRANNNWRTMAVYAFIYSWATFLGYFPTTFFEPESRAFAEAFSKMVGYSQATAPEHPGCATEVGGH